MINGALKAELSKGVFDKPLKNPETAKWGEKQTMLQAFVGPCRIEDFEQALRLTATGPGEKVEDREQDINPRFLLAKAWDYSRLDEAVQLLAEGETPDPIRVVPMHLPGFPTYYLVSDGMHRTVAARLARKKTVRALVGHGWLCDPSKNKIINRRLWTWDGDGWRSGHASRNVGVPFEVCDIAAALGVPVYWSIWLRLYRGFRRSQPVRPQ